MSQNQEMHQDTISLLKELSSGCQMAQKSVKHVREYTTEEKLDKLLEAYGEKHTAIERDVAALLSADGKEEKEPDKLVSAFSYMGVEMKMMMKGDAHEAAKIMMDGCNMGIQSVSEYLNKYTQASQESRELGEKLIKIEEEFMQEMKAFL